MANNSTAAAANHPRSLLITQAANGFIVHPDASANYCASMETSHVFQSFNELHGFLRAHFTHRSPLLSSDSGSEP